MFDEYVILWDWVLAIFAASLHVVAFGIYNLKIIQGKVQPNTATWTLWAFDSTLNCLTYFFMTEDWASGVLPFVSSLACLATFVFSLVRGQFGAVDVWEKLMMALCVMALGVWWLFHSAAYANMIVQVAMVISFIPILRSTYLDPSLEQPLPWFIWSSAYIFLFFVVIMNWQGEELDFVYPINGFVLHAIVGVLALRIRRCQNRTTEARHV